MPFWHHDIKRLPLNLSNNYIEIVWSSITCVYLLLKIKYRENLGVMPVLKKHFKYKINDKWVSVNAFYLNFQIAFYVLNVSPHRRLLI